MFLQQWTLHYTSDKNFMTSTLVINENIWHLDLETMVYIYVQLMDSDFKDESYAHKILKINESWNIECWIVELSLLNTLGLTIE